MVSNNFSTNPFMSLKMVIAIWLSKIIIHFLFMDILSREKMFITKNNRTVWIQWKIQQIREQYTEKLFYFCTKKDALQTSKSAVTNMLKDMPKRYRKNIWFVSWPYKLLYHHRRNIFWIKYNICPRKLEMFCYH